ncbi:glycerol-3-phosphate 1-O-acyltransferase PlsB [Alkalimarinus sediminis]|uniref:Glycerol-3-phosphate acyltransferase n=1 Tax=Alkalimarinus sediminis TaxID=1632866 RepID=A0A9E8KPP7_9ALTE|nr:glycerol-3-phosphate 1-O-acyltransferase PlsB [Alkalimarinus sediminis]UZW75563.1 glycerol-3-phosphate 1-O-acyltransferase PlsB [Alkalimarinus sediminis]
MSHFLGLSSFFFTILRKILFFWVKTEVVGNEKDFLQLDPDKPVCYVLQYSSFSSRLVLEQECLAAGLPSSQAPLPIGGKGIRRSFFFLYSRQGQWFRKRQSPTVTQRLKHMVHEATLNSDLDVQIVPVSLLWGREPEKQKSMFKMLLSDSWSVAGRLQKFLIILVHGRRTFVQFSKPISLKSIVDETSSETENHEEIATRKLARILRVHFRRTRQAILGPDLSHRRTLVHSLIHSTVVKDVIRETAKEEGISPEKVKARAIKYGDEIAANLSMTVIRFLSRLLSWVWNKIYNGVNIRNIETVQEIAKENAVVYVPCHRSHIDYLLLSYVLYKHGVMVPHIAAGINLNMPIVGPLLRRGGAFFMRRSFKDNKLYAAIFNEYLYQMFSKGYSVEYFVEGGRSRTGRTLQPRPGMIAMTVRSFLRNSSKPIAFVPVYVGYEKVLEGRTYLGELRGKKKEKESVFGLFRSLSNLRKSFGKVNVNFGDPIFLSKFLDEQQPHWKDQAYDAEYRPKWLNHVVNELADEIVTRINDASSINPINMTGLILLSTAKQAMDEKILASQMDTFSNLLKQMPYSPHMSYPEGCGKDWLEYAEEMGLVSRQKQNLGDIITLEGNNATLMTYYRNNILHLYAVPALIASLFQNNPMMKREKVVFLVRSIYPYIKAELFIHWSKEEISEVAEQWIDVLINNDMLHVEGDSLCRPSTGSANFVLLSVLARFIIQTIERYYISIAVLRNQGPGVLDAAELEEQSTQMAQRMSILYGLNAPEFFDKTLFRHFISNLKENGIITEDEAGKLIYSEKLAGVVEDAKLVLNAEMRQGVLQVTTLS